MYFRWLPVRPQAWSVRLLPLRFWSGPCIFYGGALSICGFREPISWPLQYSCSCSADMDLTGLIWRRSLPAADWCWAPSSWLPIMWPPPPRIRASWLPVFSWVWSPCWSAGLAIWTRAFPSPSCWWTWLPPTSRSTPGRISWALPRRKRRVRNEQLEQDFQAHRGAGCHLYCDYRRPGRDQHGHRPRNRGGQGGGRTSGPDGAASRGRWLYQSGRSWGGKCLRCLCRK